MPSEGLSDRLVRLGLLDDSSCEDYSAHLEAELAVARENLRRDEVIFERREKEFAKLHSKLADVKAQAEKAERDRDSVQCQLEQMKVQHEAMKEKEEKEKAEEREKDGEELVAGQDRSICFEGWNQKEEDYDRVRVDNDAEEKEGQQRADVAQKTDATMRFEPNENVALLEKELAQMRSELRRVKREAQLKIRLSSSGRLNFSPSPIKRSGHFVVMQTPPKQTARCSRTVTSASPMTPHRTPFGGDDRLTPRRRTLRPTELATSVEASPRAETIRGEKSVGDAVKWLAINLESVAKAEMNPNEEVSVGDILVAASGDMNRSELLRRVAKLTTDEARKCVAWCCESLLAMRLKCNEQTIKALRAQKEIVSLQCTHQDRERAMDLAAMTQQQNEGLQRDAYVMQKRNRELQRRAHELASEVNEAMATLECERNVFSQACREHEATATELANLKKYLKQREVAAIASSGGDGGDDGGDDGGGSEVGVAPKSAAAVAAPPRGNRKYDDDDACDDSIDLDDALADDECMQENTSNIAMFAMRPVKVSMSRLREIESPLKARTSQIVDVRRLTGLRERNELLSE